MLDNCGSVLGHWTIYRCYPLPSTGLWIDFMFYYQIVPLIVRRSDEKSAETLLESSFLWNIVLALLTLEFRVADQSWHCVRLDCHGSSRL